MVIDVSSFTGQWAFDVLSVNNPRRLNQEMQKEGIGKALVSPAEAICYKNPHLIIDYHFARLKPYPRFIPVPIINPLLSDCFEQVEKSMKMGALAIKLHPNYHGYDPVCSEVPKLLDFCGRKGICVIFQARMEDARRQHRVMKVPDVNVGNLLTVLENNKKTSAIICGLSKIDAKTTERLLACPNAYVDTSFLESMDTLNSPDCSAGGHYEKILFGSHSPFFYIRANISKLKSLERNEYAYRQVAYQNASKIFNLL